jgi:predicted dehydrogenase
MAITSARRISGDFISGLYTLPAPRRTASAAPALVSRAVAGNNAVMKLGLLGSDAEMAGVAAAAVHAGDSVVKAGDPPAGVPWTDLLSAAVCDAVLVGGDGWDAARAEAVRTLVQAGRTLVLAQPLELSMLWAYELDMVARDSGAVLIPFLPDRMHPFVARLRTAIETGLAGTSALGPVESVRLERRLRERTRPAVLAALSRDVDLVRVLVGEPARLGTLGAGDPDAAWPTLAVGFTGPDQVPVRWQVSPGDPGLTIAVQCARGTIEARAPEASPGDWTWVGPPQATAPFDRGAVVLEQLRESLRGRPTAAALPAATWADAARAIDLVETVPRSLARGRAIDLHQEEFSELGTFRGTMASLGCGLVLLALVVLLAATLVGGIARELDWKFGAAVAAAWPWLVLTVLVVFLALQLLPLLVGATRGAGPPKPPASDASRRDGRP